MSSYRQELIFYKQEKKLSETSINNLSFPQSGISSSNLQFMVKVMGGLIKVAMAVIERVGRIHAQESPFLSQVYFCSLFWHFLTVGG